MKMSETAPMSVFANAVRLAVDENRKLGIRFEYMENGRRRVESGSGSHCRTSLKSGQRLLDKCKLKVG